MLKVLIAAAIFSIIFDMVLADESHIAYGKSILLQLHVNARALYLENKINNNSSHSLDRGFRYLGRRCNRRNCGILRGLEEGSPIRQVKSKVWRKERRKYISYISFYSFKVEGDVLLLWERFKVQIQSFSSSLLRSI